MWDLATIIRLNRDWPATPRTTPATERPVDFVIAKKGPIFMVEPQNITAENYLQYTYRCGSFVGTSLVVEGQQVDALAQNLFEDDFVVCSSLQTGR